MVLSRSGISIGFRTYPSAFSSIALTAFSIEGCPVMNMLTILG